MTGNRSAVRRCTMFSLIALAAAAGAQAATRLTVTVTNQGNMAPLDGAVVCVGTSTNRAQHGRRTTANGVAIFESIPDGNWTVTAWKSNFTVGTSSLSVTSTSPANTGRGIVLPSGTASDPCITAGTTTPATTDVRLSGTVSTVMPLAITAFSINGGAETIEANGVVSLALQFSGGAAEYRVSEVSGTFTDPSASWRPLALSGGSIRLPTSTGAFATVAGTKRVWVQLRQGTRLSNIATDNITMVQAYSISGRDAHAAAVTRGFVFKNAPGCDIDTDGGTQLGQVFVVKFLGGGLLGSEHTCALTLFGGRSLAPGWTFTKFTWDVKTYDGNCRTSGGAPLPSASSLMPFFFQGKHCGFVLKTVDLKGPAGGSAGDAFAR